MRPFDWRVDCPRDVVRAFPAVAGKGRGTIVDETAIAAARRKMQDQKLTYRGRPT